jgi:hypothetical protein
MNEANKKFINSVLTFIIVSNIPAIVICFIDFQNGIGWVAGSFASAVNFYLMAMNTMSLKGDGLSSNAIKVSKLFLLRYAFLIMWSIFIMLFLKPNLGLYCVALFSAQLAVILYQGYLLLKDGYLKKYF